MVLENTVPLKYVKLLHLLPLRTTPQGQLATVINSPLHPANASLVASVPIFPVALPNESWFPRFMRFTILLLLMVATASAQSDAGKILEQGLQQAVAGLAPVPAQAAH